MKNKLSDHTTKTLNQYANDQLYKSTGFLSEDDSMSLEDSFDRKDLMYIHDFTEEDFINTFKLSMITESLTEQYADTFILGADIYKADWLRTYINGFWVPDELGHTDPHKKILMNFGYSELELDKMLLEAKNQTNYKETHEAGLMPVQLTTFGLFQECITDYWYDLQSSLFPANSNPKKVLLKVKGREALHTVQYRDMTALQLEDDPGLLEPCLYTTAHFEMPGNKISLVSEYESKAQKWIPLMGGNIVELLKKMIHHIQKMTDDPAIVTRILFGISTDKELVYLEKFPRPQLFSMAKSFQGCHGLIGEIILESLGIGSKVKPLPGIKSFMKEKLKTWIKSKIDIQQALS